MRPIKHIALLALMVAVLAPEVTAQLLPSFGRDRAGTSGFQFLKVPVDARSAGMGTAVASTSTDAASLFWNPALSAWSEGMNVGLGHTAYFAGVSLDYLALTGKVGEFTLGLSLQALNSGEMNVTTEFQPLGTGETFRFVDVAAGVTVSQALTDLFSYGVGLKYVQESVAGINARTGLLDLGAYYKVGTTGATMAVVIRNFGLDASPTGELQRIIIGGEGTQTETEFESLTPPTTFMLSLAYELMRANPDNSVTVAAQLTNPNDNAESLNIGVEYQWRELLTLRSGYRFGVEESNLPAFGMGILVPGISQRVRFDYGFTRLERLGNVHRASLNIGL